MKIKPAEGNLSFLAPQTLADNCLDLFRKGIQEIYHAERSIAGVMPSLVINAAASSLDELLEHHMTETHQHISRLEKIITMLSIGVEEKPCETIEAMLAEGSRSVTSAPKGVTCDLAIIAAAQKVEHFEIAAYGTLRTLAEMLGLREAAGMLDQTLDEEKLADTKLTETASTLLYMETGKTNILN